MQKLTTKQALLEVMSQRKWYGGMCTAQLANYYKKQAELGKLSETVAERILKNNFIKSEQTLWERKD